MILRKKQSSKDMAKDRLRLVLLSERMDCSVRATAMLQNDIALAVGKYLPIDKEQIRLKYVSHKEQLEIYIPISLEKD